MRTTALQRPTPAIIAIIAISLAIALTSLNHIPQHDIQASLNFHSDLITNHTVNDPVVVTLLMSTGANLLSTGSMWALLLTSSYILGIITIYKLTQDITQDKIISLYASLQYGTCSLTIVLFQYGYIKQLLATALLPLAIYYFHHTLHTNKLKDKITTGALFGIIGLTHELVFVILITFLLALIGYRLGKEHAIPSWIIQRLTIPTIITLLICGSFYLNTEMNTIIHAGGEAINQYSQFYTVYYPLLAGFIALALIGITQIKKHRDLTLSLLIAPLLLSLGWVAYADRFILVATIPLAILGGHGFKYLYHNLKPHNLTLYLLLTLGTYVALAGVTPAPFINQNLLPLYLPIHILSEIFSGWFSVLIKFLIGIPMTIAIWIISINYIYHKLYRERGEQA